MFVVACRATCNMLTGHTVTSLYRLTFLFEKLYTLYIFTNSFAHAIIVFVYSQTDPIYTYMFSYIVRVLTIPTCRLLV